MERPRRGISALSICEVAEAGIELRQVGGGRWAVPGTRPPVVTFGRHGRGNRPEVAAAGACCKLAACAALAPRSAAGLAQPPLPSSQPVVKTLVVHAGQADQGAETAPGVADDERAAIAHGSAHCCIVDALHVVGDAEAFLVEGPGAAQVDVAGGAAFEQVGGGRLADRQLGEQFGGEHVQVDFAVGVLAGRCAPVEATATWRRCSA